MPVTRQERTGKINASVVYTLETKVSNVESTGEGIAVTTGPTNKKLRKAGLNR